MIKPVFTSYGADPEGFLERDGRIVGSERVIPIEGLGGLYAPQVVRDGIQFEFNPTAGTNVYQLGQSLARCFRLLREHLKGHPGVTINFEGLVEVEREELDALSEQSRILGCQPSLNIYGDTEINVDAKVYRKRSAGGHFHFGLIGTAIADPNSLEDMRHRLICYMDMFLGNQTVLMDRDPGAVERRANYGRAGEYRLTSYGIEYRTPSNFWLRNYALMELCVGLGRMAIGVLDQSLKGEGLQDELIETLDNQGVTMDDFRDAINKNDWDLAMSNFEALRPFLVKHLNPRNIYPIHSGNIDGFTSFVKGVKEKGLGYYFPEHPVKAWSDHALVDFRDFVRTL